VIIARRTISIDEKIERANETVSRAKTKYDAELDELEKLFVKKEEDIVTMDDFKENLKNLKGNNSNK
jgi:hypothetical protein